MREELSYAAFQYLSIINAPKRQEEIASEIPPRGRRATEWFSLGLAVIEWCRVERRRRLQNVQFRPFLVGRRLTDYASAGKYLPLFDSERRPRGAVIALRSGDRRGRRNV